MYEQRQAQLMFAIHFNFDYLGAACRMVVKLLDLDPQGRWFDPWSRP